MSSIQAHLRSHTNEETLIGHMDGVEGLLTDIKGYVDAVETKLGEVVVNTANINVNVGDVEVNVADMEALQTITNTKLNGGLPTALSGSGNLKVSIEEGSSGGGDASASNQVALEASLTSMEGKQDALISANHTDLVALEASLTAMEGKQDALISANHTDLVALEASLTAMEGKQDALISANHTDLVALLTPNTRVATQLLYGTGNLVANNLDESSTNHVELKNNGSDYFSVFITAENTAWYGYLQYSYDGITWFTDINVNGAYASTYNANAFKHGRYVRVKISNTTAGTPGTTNAFVVHIVQ